jgi:hypothetical protein
VNRLTVNVSPHVKHEGFTFEGWKIWAMAGRSMPLMRLSTNMPAAMVAPEFPALTAAQALPSFTRSKASLTDELRFLRTASEAESCMPTTSLA